MEGQERGPTPADLVMVDFRECWETIRHLDDIAGRTVRFYATFEGTLITAVAALIGLAPRLVPASSASPEPFSRYLPLVGAILVFGGFSGMALYANVLWIRRSFRSYLATLNRIRGGLLSGSPLRLLYLTEWLTPMRRHNARVHFWRGVFLTVVNSAILSAGAWFLSGDGSWILNVGMSPGGLSLSALIGAGAALVVHSFVYWLIILRGT